MQNRPFLCDRFGRKLAIIIGCIIMIIAAVVQVCAQNLAMFKGARFLMGFGNSLAQLSSPLLLTELCHPQHRGRVTAIYNCLWNVGFIINTWLSFGTQHIQSTWSWRLPTLLQGLPSAIQLAFIWFIPESPRWLIAQDRSDEALAILARYHANGNDQDPVVAWEFAEIKETLRLEFLYKKTSTYLDFLKTKGNRYRLLLIASLGLFSQWSGNGLISYYSANVYESIGITNPTTQLGINGGQSILSLIVSVTCAMFVDKFGRRPFFLVSTAGMLLCFMSWTICAAYYVKGNVAAGKATLVFIWLFNVSYALAWSGLLVAYTVEILPYKLRAKGLMIMNFFVQVALVINQYVNPYGFDDLHPQYKLYVIYTVSLSSHLPFHTPANQPHSAGLPSSSSLFTSYTSRLRAYPSKRSPRSSTARTPRLVSRKRILRSLQPLVLRSPRRTRVKFTCRSVLSAFES